MKEKFKKILLVLCIVTSGALLFVSNAAGATEEQKLIAALDGAANDDFGNSVSVYGDTAVIGAYGDDVGKGSAYVFTRSGSTWTQQAKLNESDGEVNDLFGVSVSVYGDTAVIGAMGDNNSRGSAYVFTRSGSTWIQQAELKASDGAASDDFGVSVSVYGDTAVIGAWSDDGEKGSAYVFTRSGSTWTQQAKLNASDGARYDEFGVSVSVYGDTAVIGADELVNNGSAYVFTRSGSTWTQQAELNASNGAIYDRFGFSVSVYGDTAVIGTLWNNDHKGSAYVFTRSGSTWTQQAELNASDGASNDFFGISVSVYGDIAVIGANDDDVGNGSAYVFTRSGSTWTQQAKLNASDGAASDDFGVSVSVYGNTAVIGALGDDRNKGSAYVFSLGTSPEADIRFDPTSKDIKVYNKETGSEASYIILPTKKGKDRKEMPDEDGEKGWELRQYMLNDTASNSLVLVLEHKKEGNEAMVKVLSMQYNSGEVLKEVKNKMQVEYSSGRNGALKELQQDIEVKKLFNVEAKYNAQKGKTEIKVDIEGQKEKKETREGIVILELLTDKGRLKLRY